MKHAITVSILLLWGPSLASAQFTATSGTVVDNSDQVPYAIAGPGFSTSGVMAFSEAPPINLLNSPMVPATYSFILEADTENPNLSVSSMIVHGVPWALPSASGIPNPGTALVEFTTGNFIITGSGTYTGTFTFNGAFFGVPLSVLSAKPGADCVQLVCTELFFGGGGTVRLDVGPALNLPGSFEISQATFTFQAPEPSTTVLFLAGLAALGFHLWARTRGLLAPRNMRFNAA